MKVADLIELLGDFDPEAEVHMAFPAGDYWRNTLAPSVCSVGDGSVRHSTYHDQDILVEDRYEDDEDEDQTPERRGRPVVVIGF